MSKRHPHFVVLALLAAACTSSPTSHEPQPAQSVAAASAEAPDPERAQQLAAQARERIQAGDKAQALELLREADQAGYRDVDACLGAASATASSGQIDASLLWLERAVDAGFDDVEWLETEATLAPVRSHPKFAGLHERMRLQAGKTAREKHIGEGLARSTPEAEGLDAAALTRLLDEARAARSSAVVVLREGKVVVEEYFGGWSRRIEAMSGSKSIVELAVGLAVGEGKIQSIDQPVYEFFPEWRQGRKEQVTIRHLLNHTSGMQARPTTEEIYRSPDFVRLALAAELDDEPGTRFFYNNKAVNLVPGIVQKATGTRMDEYLREKLFRPLGIEDVTWSLDRAGNPHGMAGLQIHPIDWAKIGQMLLDGGTWKGERVLSSAWISESTKSGQTFAPHCGLLWWLVMDERRTTLPAGVLEEVGKLGFAGENAAKIQDLVGRPIPPQELREQMIARLGEETAEKFWRLVREAKIQPEVTGTPTGGFQASGYLGQYLVVLPKERIVAVRMTTGAPGMSNEAISMTSFVDRVRDLVR